MARLDKLGSVKEVAQTAAVIGREFDHALIGAVAPLGAKKLNVALQNLIEAELVFRHGRSGEQRYVFKHALVQEAAYESLLKKRRQGLHGDIARALIDHFPEKTEPELVAHHLTEGKRPSDAIEYWHRAGRKALEKSADTEAIAHFERALGLLDHIEDERERAGREITIRILLRSSLVGMRGAASPGVAENNRRALALCEEFGQTDQLFPALWGVWSTLTMQFNSREARDVGSRLLAISWELDDPSLEIEAHHCQWTSNFLLGDVDAVLEHTKMGIELYDPQQHHDLTFTYGGHDPGVCARQIGALGLWLAGYPDRSLLRIEDAFDLAKSLGHRHTRILVLGFGVILATSQRDLAQALNRADALLTTTRDAEYMLWQSLAETTKTLAEYICAAPGHDTEALFLSTNRCLEKGGAFSFPIVALAVEELARHGALDLALRTVRKASEAIERADMRWCESEIVRVHGELIHLQGGNHAGNAAEERFERAIDIARGQGAKSLELRAVSSLARLWRRQHKSREAATMLSDAYDWFSEGFGTADLKSANALLAELS